MRVLMATMQLDIGGAETHIVELSKALKRRGVDVYVASNGGAYETELLEAGIPHFKVPFHSKNPISLSEAYKELKRIIISRGIDVVHAHARIPAAVISALHKQLDFAFVTTAHWVFSTRFPYNLLTKWGERSLAVSEDIKKYLIDNYGVPSEHIRVTINGIDTEKFSANVDYSDIAAEFDLREGKRRIVYVSRMDVDRSLVAHKLIEIAPDLYKKIDNLEIVIVGGGNDLDAVRREAMSANDKVGRKFIRTTGSRTDINKFAASGEIFIGVSRAALEAMACEKPSIIAGNEGYIGIFDSDKLDVSIATNFCCRGCGDSTADKLKSDILTLMNAPEEEQKRLGKYARETVIEHYSVETMADDALKMYGEVYSGELTESEEETSLLPVDGHARARRKVDVVISGYYGFKNSGDDSILKAMIASLKRLKPGINIVALSNTPEETEKEYGVKSVHRFNIPAIYMNLRRAKLLISGGGSLIQDVTSDKSLAYYLGIISLGKMCGTKVMLYANGIGPIQNPNNYKRVAKAIDGVRLITLREESSLEELRTMGADVSEAVITADPAFTLKAAEDSEIMLALNAAGMPSGAKYFCVSVRPWKNNSPDFERVIAGVCEEVIARYKLVPVFIPMQSAKDTEISERILSKIPSGGYLLRGALAPEDILGIVGGAEFVIGMRLHTLIYSAKMSTPVIGLIYDPKIEAVMKSLNQIYAVPVSSPNPLTLRRQIDEIMKNRDKISEELKHVSEKVTAAAEQNAILAVKLLEET